MTNEGPGQSEFRVFSFKKCLIFTYIAVLPACVCVPCTCNAHIGGYQILQEGSCGRL